MEKNDLSLFKTKQFELKKCDVLVVLYALKTLEVESLKSLNKIDKKNDLSELELKDYHYFKALLEDIHSAQSKIKSF